MNTFLDWGIPILTAFQGFGDWLMPIMSAFTFLGDEMGYLLVMPFFLWSVDFGLGLRFGTIVLTSSAVNTMLKWIFSLPRPYWVDPRVEGLALSTNFGFPSGHAQSAMAAWGRLIHWIRQRWATILFGALILLISVSRWYLGVHYPADTIGGWIVGLALVWLFVKFEGPVSSYLTRQPIPQQVILVFLASVVMVALGFGLLAITQRSSLPESWELAALSNAAEADETFDLYDPSSVVTAAGTLFGFGLGAIYIYRRGHFSTAGSWVQRLARYVVGLIGMVALYVGLSALLPSGTDPLALILRYVRYAILGFWGSYLAPRLFVAIGLAEGSSAPSVN